MFNRVNKKFHPFKEIFSHIELYIKMVCQLSFPTNLVTKISGAWQNSETGITRTLDIERLVRFRQIGNFLDIDFDDLIIDGVLFKTRVLGSLIRKSDFLVEFVAISPALGNTQISFVTSPIEPNRVLGFLTSQLSGPIALEDGRLLLAAFEISQRMDGNDQELVNAMATAEASRDVVGLPDPLPEDIICKLRFKNILTNIEGLLQAEDGEQLIPINEERSLVFKRLANLVDVGIDIPIDTGFGPFSPKFFAILSIENNELFLRGTSPVLGIVKFKLITNPDDVYEVVSFEQTASAGVPNIKELVQAKINKATALLTPRA